jgi:hypothetical protein
VKNRSKLISIDCCKYLVLSHLHPLELEPTTLRPEVTKASITNFSLATGSLGPNLEDPTAIDDEKDPLAESSVPIEDVASVTWII